jgi:hypothetical protein
MPFAPEVEADCGSRYGGLMATPRSRQAARLRARRRRAQHRARRIVLLVVVVTLLVVTLSLTAFGAGDQKTPRAAAPTPATGTSTNNAAPSPAMLATVSNLRLQVPIAADAVTGIGFHGRNGGGLELQPVGRQANEGVLARLWRSIAGTPTEGPVWYQLGDGPGTDVVDVGAAPGTDVYAPVDGSVVAISEFVIDGKAFGSRIDIRPSAAPSVIVSLTHLRPDPALVVGSPVLASTSKIGTVVDVARVERQALGDHARAAGNNVAIEVFPAAGSLP